MAQPQNVDPKAAQELMTRLNEEITNSKNEKSMLEDRLGDGLYEGARSYDELLVEIEELKDELDQRPSQEVVEEMERKVDKYKARKLEWRDQINDLISQLYEAESRANKQEGLKEKFEREVGKLREDLKEKIRKKEEVIARLEVQQADKFDVGEFLRGGLGEVPSKPNHRASNLDEVRRMKARRDKEIFPLKEAGAIKWADQGGRFVISLPSVIYNGKAQLTELFHGHVVTDSVYEVFVADKDITYHGSYRCLKRAQMDWDILASFGQAFVESFLNRLVAEKEFAAPVIVTLIEHMYKSGFLKAECLAFQYEGPSRGPRV